jgi:predicted AAA+ superfamily ATPase
VDERVIGVLENYIKRDMEDLVIDLSKQYPAILVTGPRQVGKTTMLKKLMEGTDRTYVTLDDLSDRKLAKEDPEMFFQKYKTPIFIDEVQYAPELFIYIKIMIDKNKNSGDFWLSGSQIFKLMRGVSESLAGRIAVLNLTSLSQNEIYNKYKNFPFTLNFDILLNKSKSIKPCDTKEIFERIYRGSMPAIIDNNGIENNVFYNSYLSTYLDRDVKELTNTIDSIKFYDFIVSLACRVGQIMNHADIAREVGINQVMVKDWLNILETLGIIFYLHTYSNNTIKRVIKTPKLYFYDTGLVAHLTKWSSAEALEQGAMNGSILENYAISEIIKSYYNEGREPFIYYYRDKDMKEIDLIMEMDGKVMPIEIKKTANPPSEILNTFKVLDKPRVLRGKGAVLCMKNDLSAFDKDNYIIPIWLI